MTKTKYDHDLWPAFSVLWRRLLLGTRSCFERDCLRDVKEGLWKKYQDLQTVVSTQDYVTGFPPGSSADPEISEFLAFWLNAQNLCERGSVDLRVVVSIGPDLWERWRVRSALL